MAREYKKPNKLLPSHTDSRIGSKLALQNARRHLRAASALGKMRYYGFASAHVVLAIEELAKAWVLALCGMGVKIPPEMMTEILIKHAPRHAITFGFLYVFMIQHVVLRISKRVQQRHRVKGYPPELRDEWAAELTREFESLSSRSPKTEPVLAVWQWIRDANDLKNRGLYVDFDGAKWVNPQRISARSFAFGYGVAAQLIQRLGREIGKLRRLGGKLERLGVHTDRELNVLFEEQLAKVHDTSLQEMLKQLAELALSPLSAKR